MTRAGSQCDRVLEVLADGRWHGIREIHDRAGTMRLNSRVAELRRRRGLQIECSRIDGEYGYRLTLEEGQPAHAESPGGQPYTGRPSSSDTDSATLRARADALLTAAASPDCNTARARNTDDVVDLLAAHGFDEAPDQLTLLAGVA